jgi:hypothetical protein
MAVYSRKQGEMGRIKDIILAKELWREYQNAS